MSKQNSPAVEPSQLTPQQNIQQRFTQLSDNAKAPIRQVISQMEEVVLNSISSTIQAVVMAESSRDQLNVEIMRLRKLCDDNKIDWKPKPPNRAQERKSNGKK